MRESSDDILEYLAKFANRKEETEKELVQIETRLEDRITEIKTDLKQDIIQVKTDSEGDIREVKTDLKDDIKLVRDDIKLVRDDIKDKVSGLRWFIVITVAIAAIIVPIIIKNLS